MSSSSKNSAPMGLRRAGTSFWSSIYDCTVRTNSYNEFAMKMGILASSVSPSSRHHCKIDIDMDIDTLLQPNQKTVEKVLHASHKLEGSKIMKIVLDYFDWTWKAARLCGTLLHCICEARDQRHHIEMMLSTMSRMVNESWGFLQFEQMGEGLHETAQARNPFLDNVVKQMFADVEEGYKDLSQEIEKRRNPFDKEVWVMEKSNEGCILYRAIRVVVGVMVVTMVVALQALASIARITYTRTLKRVPYCAKTQSFKGIKQYKKQQKKCIWKRISSQNIQRDKIEAIARGSFIVKRMLDTLRCLMVGLEEDVESKRRLAEYGYNHREEVVCVQQVLNHLYHSRQHLDQQLDSLQEQVIVCLLIINKARSWVLQEFSTSSSTP